MKSNVCWNNGFYDRSEAKCICSNSTYGKYCEYCKHLNRILEKVHFIMFDI